MKLIKNPVLGAICGDIIGSIYEWYCHRHLSIDKNFKLFTDDSRFTDDTVMTLAVANWLLGNDLIESMKELGHLYPDAGYGGMFRKWLRERNPQPYNSFGNGSAMRVSPVGCISKDRQIVLQKAEESAVVSHNHPEGIKGAKIIADIIWFIKNNPNCNLNEIRVFCEPYDYNLNRTPWDIKKSHYKFDSTCQGSVPEAICCFLDSKSYEETVRNAVWLRGDADTQAAIAGSLAAAYWGVPSNIAYEALERLSDKLYDIYQDFSDKYNLDS